MQVLNELQFNIFEGRVPQKNKSTSEKKTEEIFSKVKKENPFKDSNKAENSIVSFSPCLVGEEFYV